MRGHYDVVVVGGGPVGAALAVELHNSGLRVVLLDSREAARRERELRPLALSYGTHLIFGRMGLSDILPPVTRIDRIHVSQRGRFGRTVLSAIDAQLPALGYVSDYASLVEALERGVARSGVQVQRGARVTSLAHGSASARVEFASPNGIDECLASVVVVADGNASAAAVDVRTADYAQSAITALVETELSHRNTAYERFTPEGPIALLPFEQQCALVWTVRADEAEGLAIASNADFLRLLGERFGDRLGRFAAVGPRAVHRLTLRVAQRVTVGRAALIGNAAQSLHPVAGQGFNLGLRDAWELAREIKRRGVDDPHLLEAYRARRRIDRAGGIAFTDSVIRIFSNDFFPAAIARGAALALLDNVPAAKDFVVRRMVFGSRG